MKYLRLLFLCLCLHSFGQMMEGTAETYHNGAQAIETYFNNGEYELRDTDRSFTTKSIGVDPRGFGFNIVQNNVKKEKDLDNVWGKLKTISNIQITNLPDNYNYFTIEDNGEAVYNSLINSQNNLTNVVEGVYGQFGIQFKSQNVKIKFYDFSFIIVPLEIDLNLSLDSHETIDSSGLTLSYDITLESNYAVDIHWALGKTYDYFEDVHDRYGLGGISNNVVAYLYRGGKSSLAYDAFAKERGNIFENNILFFGSGILDYRKPMTMMEVVSHEYTHLLLAKANKLQPNNTFSPSQEFYAETRALNESICDAFGVIVRHYYDTNGYEIEGVSINWEISNLGLGDSFNEILRDVSDPSNSNMIHSLSNGNNNDRRQVDTYEFLPDDASIVGNNILQGPNWVDVSYGLGEDMSYKNMGPANYWFYLIANEEFKDTPLVSVNDEGTNYSVKALGIRKAEKLLYYLITDSPDLNRDSKYIDYAYATINAAIYFKNLNLHGYTQDDVQSIRDAWHAVGVLNNPNEFCNSGTVLTDDSGLIQDGSLNQDYNNNQNCSWIIQPAGASSVTVDFTLFDLGNGDSLTVYDGVDNTTSVLGTYSGNSLPASISSSTGAVFIEFLTDNSNTGDGWSLNYSSVTSTEYCNSLTEIFDANAEFGDGSGSENYGNNSHCSWRIAPENATYINLEFLSFDLEDGHDFVSIYDGLNAEDGTLIGTFTGSNIPNSLTASTGQAFIVFVSNNMNNQQGWTINYTSDGIQPCSGTTILNAENGTVSDGSGTDNYGNNANCSWLIQPESSTSITLIFDELNLQEPTSDGNTTSLHDYLEIYDGTDDSGEPMVVYTGNQFLPIIVQSSGDSLFIKFVSNSSITDSGWQFTYTSSATDYCSGTNVLDATTGTISDGSGSNNYNASSDCRWLIQPENATSIELTFTAFDTEIGQDGVVVYDGPDTSFPYTAYSGSNLPNTIYSSGGAMLVRFLSDAQNEFQGFEANYIANIAPEGNPNSIVSYQYWFNDDYANVTSSSNFGAVNTLNLNIQSNTSSLSNGLNTLHIRTKDALGFWSSVLSEYVYIQNANSSGSSNKVVSYEYWFDDEYNNKVTGIGSGINPLILNLNTNVNTLEKGLHQFHIRFKDEKGAWSSIISEFIYKNNPEGLGNNMISAYRYWFNDDFDNRVSETVSLEVNYMFLEDIDISGLTDNTINYIHFQFKDIYNNWSSVLTEEFLFETLSINEPNAERLKLYPNPTNSIIFITTIVEDGRLTIYDNLGKLIQEFDTIPSEIDISNLENGLYLFQIKSKNKVYQEKVIKF